MKRFVQTTTVARKLTIVFAAAALFLLLQFGGSFIYSRQFLRGLADTYEISNLSRSMDSIVTEVDLGISRLREILDANKDLTKIKVFVEQQYTKALKELTEIRTKLPQKVTYTRDLNNAEEMYTKSWSAAKDLFHTLMVEMNLNQREWSKDQILIIEHYKNRAAVHLSNIKVDLQQTADQSFESSYRIRNHPIVIGVVLSGFFVLLVIILGSSITRQMSRSIANLIRLTRLVAVGDFTKRATILSTDELGALTQSFNNMASDLNETTVSKDYVDNVIKSMVDSLIVINTDGTIRTVNHATLHLLGYREMEMVGKYFEMILEKETEFYLETLIREGNLTDHDVSYKTKGGETIPMSFSASVMKDKNGRAVGIVSVAKDMRRTLELLEKEKQLVVAAEVAETERKRAQEVAEAYKKLQETQAMLVQAGKLTALGELGAGIAHELNQPLAAIRGYSQVMLEELEEDNPHKSDLKKIEEQTGRMSKIIDNIRTFARSSKMTVEPIDIHQPIDDAFQLLKAQLKNHNIKVVREFEKDLPMVSGDGNRLQQVFINLATNARDALDKNGGGTIWVRTKSSLKSLFPEEEQEGVGTAAKSVVIEFENDGPEIPGDIIDKIFDPFFTTKEAGKGTGLGMSISYGIIKDHRGTIEVASGPGSGVVFTIKLPVFRM